MNECLAFVIKVITDWRCPEKLSKVLKDNFFRKRRDLIAHPGTTEQTVRLMDKLEDGKSSPAPMFNCSIKITSFQMYLST